MRERVGDVRQPAADAGLHRPWRPSAGIDVEQHCVRLRSDRSLGATRIVDGDGSGGAQIDIGAHGFGDTIIVDHFDGQEPVGVC